MRKEFGTVGKILQKLTQDFQVGENLILVPKIIFNYVREGTMWLVEGDILQQYTILQKNIM